MKGAGAAEGGIALNASARPADVRRALASHDSPPALLNILVLGGTGFIGPHLVHQLVERGHHVSIFTRGRRAADLPASVTRLIGDRDAKNATGQPAGNYESRQGKKWDAVFDDWANNSVWVRKSTAVLKGATPLYLFVSSTGVFYPYRKTNTDESMKTRMAITEEAAAPFGVAKSQSEQTTRDVFGKGAIIFARDISWAPVTQAIVSRIGWCGLHAAVTCSRLGRRNDPSQFVDVRDLAAFMI